MRYYRNPWLLGDFSHWYDFCIQIFIKILSSESSEEPVALCRPVSPYNTTVAVVREASDYIRALQLVCFVASAVHDIRSSPAIVYTDLSLNTAQPCQSVMLDYQIHKLCKPCSVR